MLTISKNTFTSSGNTGKGIKVLNILMIKTDKTGCQQDY